jgi:hypothetical protein
LPLGIVVLAFPGSRLDTSDAVGQFPGMRDKQNALADCDPLLSDHAAQNDATLPTGLPPSTVASILEMPVHNSQEALQGNVHDQRARVLDLHHDLPLPKPSLNSLPNQYVRESPGALPAAFSSRLSLHFPDKVLGLLRGGGKAAGRALLSPGSAWPTCREPQDVSGGHAVSRCARGSPAVSRNLQHSMIARALRSILCSCRPPVEIDGASHAGQGNDERPTDVYNGRTERLSVVESDHRAAAFDVIVSSNPRQPLIVTDAPRRHAGSPAAPAEIAEDIHLHAARAGCQSAIRLELLAGFGASIFVPPVRARHTWSTEFQRQAGCPAALPTPQ